MLGGGTEQLLYLCNGETQLFIHSFIPFIHSFIHLKQGISIQEQILSVKGFQSKVRGLNLIHGPNRRRLSISIASALNNSFIIFAAHPFSSMHDRGMILPCSH